MLKLDPSFWGIFLTAGNPTEQEWRYLFVRKLQGDIMNPEVNLMSNNNWAKSDIQEICTFTKLFIAFHTSVAFVKSVVYD